MADRLCINGIDIAPGERKAIDLDLPGLYSHTPITTMVNVLRGKRPGPTLFVSAAIHGDELNGVEIVRRLLAHPGIDKLKGNLLAIPVVNVYGVIHHSRYLPDRRDLNRSFPGSDRGSLTARLADLFMSEIVAHCAYGIDLHTGAVHRENLPQIRANMDDQETFELAQAFGVPVIMNSKLLDGSLRQAANNQGVRMLLYEAGEALRFDEVSIRAGVNGVLNVMRELGMLSKRGRRKKPSEPFLARSSTWLRAPKSGVMSHPAALGAEVAKGDTLAAITDPFGDETTEVVAHATGVIVGRTTMPLVHEGDALFHIGRFEDAGEAASEVEAFQAGYDEMD